MSAHTKNWLNYYRASLADGARCCPTKKIVDDARHFACEGFKDGFLPRDLAKSLCAVGKDYKGGESRAEEEATEVEVFIFPWIWASTNWNGRPDGRDCVVPVVVMAKLQKSGQLQPHSYAPWIPRDRLEPVSHGVTVGELSKYDEYVGRQGSFSPVGWSDVFKYAETLSEKFIGCIIEDLEFSGYQRQAESRVCLADAASDGMIEGPLLVYDELLKTGGGSGSALDGLLRHVGTDGARPVAPCAGAKALDLAGKHWATVSDEHPLADSQRLAIMHVLGLSEGDVLAVQGPPGTGKTTLLKSVVAQLWVTAAIEGAACPIIAASSTNNQAVTNIIDAFKGDSAAEAGPWSQRWLPQVCSWGLYAASKKENGAGEPAGVSYHRIEAKRERLSGFFQDIETADYFEKAEPFFLEKARQAEGGNTGGAAKLMLESVRDRLQAELREIKRRITAGFASLGRMAAECGSAGEANLAEAVGARTVVLADELAAAREQEASWAGRKRMVAAADRAWQQRIANEPWWQILFSWLSSVRERRDAGRRLVMQDFVEVLGEPLVADLKKMDGVIDASRRETERRWSAASNEVSTAEQAQAFWAKLRADFGALVEQLCTDAKTTRHAQELPRKYVAAGRAWPVGMLQADGHALNALLDITWRVRAFRLATHFWEAAYLIELRAWLADKNRPDINSEGAAREQAYRRWAKLTPCLVATFYMLPKFFRLKSSEPMLGVIDLLVCDEAGQVSPEVAVASFALARRALVVGDVKQIEPVWRVPLAVDVGNAIGCALVARDQAQAEWGKPKKQAVSAGRGNLMALAQQASKVCQIAEFGGGLFLSEHRRCVPEIAAYCNTSSLYDGKLEPKRLALALDKREALQLPALGYAALNFSSEISGGSRGNREEAEMIADWLKQRRVALEEYYAEQGMETPSLRNIVAVITPFRRQKEFLQKALTEALGKEHGVVAGTVHALQGAERPLIIFSPVYGAEHQGSYFFNQGWNMLNVAVSRAKDSFLVFGCLDAFQRNLSTPAGALGSLFFGEHGGEIVDLPWRKPHANVSGTSLLSDTVAHDEALRKAVTSATNRVVISSPFLSITGLEARGILSGLAEAVKRGVLVEVFVDFLFTDDPFRREAFEAAQRVLVDARIVVRRSKKECGIHAKTLAVDDVLLVEGSFNWLSAAGHGQRYARHETSLVYSGPKVAELIGRSVAALRARCP